MTALPKPHPRVQQPYPKKVKAAAAQAAQAAQAALIAMKMKKTNLLRKSDQLLIITLEQK